jgi:predicted DNA binding protein
MPRRNRRPFTAYKPTVELGFWVADESCFLTSESERVSSQLVVDEMIQQSTGNMLQFVSVYGNAATQVLSDALTWPAIVDAKIVAENSDATLLELVFNGSSLAQTVMDSRALPRHVSASYGRGQVLVEVPPSTDPQHVINVFQNNHPNSKLTFRRKRREGPMLSETMFRERLLERLTDRQREILEHAYENGYFEKPRATTGSECAAALGISQSTFSQHLGVALNKVLGGLVGEQDVASPPVK